LEKGAKSANTLRRTIYRRIHSIGKDGSKEKGTLSKKHPFADMQEKGGGAKSY